MTYQRDETLLSIVKGKPLFLYLNCIRCINLSPLSLMLLSALPCVVRHLHASLNHSYINLYLFICNLCLRWRRGDVNLCCVVLLLTYQRDETLLSIVKGKPLFLYLNCIRCINLSPLSLMLLSALPCVVRHLHASLNHSYINLYLFICNLCLRWRRGDVN